MRSCGTETGAKKGWPVAIMGRDGWSGKSCVVAFLSCLRDCDGDDVMVIVIKASVFGRGRDRVEVYGNNSHLSALEKVSAHNRGQHCLPS